MVILYLQQSWMGSLYWVMYVTQYLYVFFFYNPYFSFVTNTEWKMDKRALTCNPHFLWSHPNMWLLKLLPKLQPFVAISLFIAFLLVFGLPAFSKFRKMEVYIKETHLESVPLKTPAITICVEPVSCSSENCPIKLKTILQCAYKEILL